MEQAETLRYVLGLLQALAAAWCYVMHSDIKKAKEDIASNRLFIAENYTTKSESTRAFDTLAKSLETFNTTLMARLDRIDSKLDSKMDKHE